MGTLIQLATRYEFIEIVKFMASKVQNPNAPKTDGLTPIYLTVIGGHTKIVRLTDIPSEK